MIENYIRNIAEENEYRGSVIFYKEIENYLIIMQDDVDGILIEVRTGLSDEVMPAGVGEKVAVIAERENVSECIINQSSILLYLANNSMPALEVSQTTHELTDLLKEHLIPDYYECELCKQDDLHGMTNIIQVNTRIMRVHNTCYDRFLDTIVKKKEIKNGKYFPGVIGALLFGALATIPWIIVGILGWIASILGMVIGISANYGYNKFGGKQSKAKAPILIGVLVIMVILAGFVTQLYDVFKYLTSQGIENVSVIEGLQLIFILFKEDAEYATSFLMSSAMGVGFGLLGSWRVIKNNSGEPTINKLQVEVLE